MDIGTNSGAIQSNVHLARTLLNHMVEGDAPDAIVALVSTDVSFEIPGDEDALPWIGRANGKQAVVCWLEGLGTLVEPQGFHVKDILASKTRVSVIGSLQALIRATGRTTTTQFAMILTIADGLIGRFQMLEDSFAVSRAARS